MNCRVAIVQASGSPSQFGDLHKFVFPTEPMGAFRVIIHCYLFAMECMCLSLTHVSREFSSQITNFILVCLFMYLFLKLNLGEKKNLQS